MKQSERIRFTSALLKGRKYQICSKIPFVNYENKNYGNNTIRNVDEGKKILLSGIEGNKAFFAGRFGTSECRTFVQYHRRMLYGSKTWGCQMDEITNNAGFFPKDSNYIEKYCTTVLPLIHTVDLLCVMNSVGEEYIVKKYCPSAKLTRLPVVDPCKNGWTSVLKDKKVLVVHPMAELIEKQYKEKQPLIFPNSDILPKFELKTVKAVQTIAGNVDKRFNDWFEALDYMTEEVLSNKFDIALIGCGAYGFPLSARIKLSGGTVIHMGGALQLLFGIRGGRWDVRNDMQKFFNDAWVHPQTKDCPKNFKKVEGGCYW